MAVYAPCMFCEKTDSPLTKEDVLPKWLVKELSGSHETRFQYGAGSYRPGRFAAQDFDHERQNVGNLGVVTRGPCQRCNNEWMSQLEQRAKVVVAPLLKGQPTTLDLKQIATLAEWTTKTAVCWDYVRPDRRYFTQAERGTLYKTLSAAPPRTLSLLPGTRVYVARYRGPQVTASIAGKLILPVTTSAAPPHGFVFTVALGELCLQLFVVHHPEELHPSFSVPDQFHDSCRLLWPNSPWQKYVLPMRPSE